MTEHHEKSENTSEKSTIASAPILKILAEARLKAGKTYAQVSKSLNIQVAFLRAIEEGDLGALPETVYTLGFVRTYGNHLGLDGARCAQDYKEQVLFAAPLKQGLTSPRFRNESTMPKRALIVLGLLIALGSYMGWLYISEENQKPSFEGKLISDDESKDSSDPLSMNNDPEVEDPSVFEDISSSQEESTEQEQDSQEAQNALSTHSSSSETLSETKALSPKNDKIIIEASQRSWIEIRDGDEHGDQKILYRGILNPGETYEVPKENHLLFTTGNAGGITFIIDGKKTPPLGSAGQIKRKLPLTKDSLSVVGSSLKPEKEKNGETSHATTREGN